MIFGSGTLTQLKSEIEKLGCKSALVLTTPQQASIGEDVRKQLGSTACGLYSNATMHTPYEVTEDALKMVEKTKADCVVSVGGGSTSPLVSSTNPDLQLTCISSWTWQGYRSADGSSSGETEQSKFHAREVT